MITITNPLRPWLHREDERQQNPSAALIAALTVVGLGAGGYGLYRYMHRTPSATTSGGTQPGGGGSKLPTGPTTPTDYNLLRTAVSPYMTGTAKRSPGGQPGRQYEVYAHFAALGRYDNHEQYSTTEYVGPESDALSRLEMYKWYFGRPTDADDIYVSSRDTGFFDGHPRGAVWQSVQNGKFYFSLVGANGEQEIYSDYNGIDMAEKGLSQQLQVMV